MEAFITKILEIAKFTSKFFVVVAILTSFLLFAPSNYVDTLGLTQLVIDYKQYIGASFLVSGVVTVTNLVMFIYRKINSSILEKRALKQQHKRLHKLNAFEKKILLYYFIKGTNTQLLAFNDGTVRELEGYRIIQRTSNLSQWGVSFPYNLNPWAREYLTKHPDLLELSDEEVELIQLETARRRRW